MSLQQQLSVNKFDNQAGKLKDFSVTRSQVNINSISMPGNTETPYLSATFEIRAPSKNQISMNQGAIKFLTQSETLIISCTPKTADIAMKSKNSVVLAVVFDETVGESHDLKQELLKGILEEPEFESDHSLSPKKLEKSFNLRKTINVEELEHEKIQQELKGLSEKPEIKSNRRLTVMPEYTVKSVDCRRSLIPTEMDLNNSFVEELEIQQELKGLSEVPELKNDRRLSYSQQEPEKPKDLRRSMIPTQEPIRESFAEELKYERFQQELKGVSDKPEIKSNRRLTVMSGETEKLVDCRRSMSPCAKDLNDSFVEELELYQELKGLSIEPELKNDRRLSYSQQESVKPKDSRRSMIPTQEPIRESFAEELEHEKLQQELKGVSENPTIEKYRRLSVIKEESESVKPKDSRMSIIPTEQTLNESFEKELKQQKLQQELKNVSAQPDFKKSSSRFSMGFLGKM